MSEDSIFIVKVEQYLLRSKRKSLKKTRLYSLLFMYMYVSVGEEKKRQTIALI